MTSRIFLIPHVCTCPSFRPGENTDFLVEAVSQTGYGRCPNCGQWHSLTEGKTLEMSTRGKCLHIGKWADTAPAPGRPLEVGCWAMTERWDEAVVIGIHHDFIEVRYEATRCHDNETIWVRNAENPWEVTWMREPDEESRRVLTLRGPYGED